MGKQQRRPSRPIDAGDNPENPLRSFRMSMLGHGFVDDPAGHDLQLDESEAISYGVVRIRRQAASLGWLVFGLVLAAAIIVGVIVFT